MSGKRPFKKEKIEERILHDVNVFLRTHMRDSRLKFVSVTKVEISADYSHAKVYWDTFDSDIKVEAEIAFSKVRGKIRSMLAKTLKIRHTPELNFVYDSQFESEKAISEILDEESGRGKHTGSQTS